MRDETTQAEVEALVQSELDTISSPELKRELAEYLIEPVRETRKWDYSTSGEHFTVWIVARFPGHDVQLAYSDFGHGAYGNRWGIVPQSDNRFGMDDAWFSRLEDAFISSGRYSGPIPDDYEIP